MNNEELRLQYVKETGNYIYDWNDLTIKGKYIKWLESKLSNPPQVEVTCELKNYIECDCGKRKLKGFQCINPKTRICEL